MKPSLGIIVTLLAIHSLAFSQSRKGADSLLINGYLEQAQARKAAKDWRGASDFINKAALTYWENRNFNKAIDLFHLSLALNQLIDNQSGIFGIHNNLAFLHSDLAQYDSAIIYFNKVLAGRRQLKQAEPIISALINTSIVLNHKKKYDESVKLLEEALELAKENNFIDRIVTCYGLLAETYEKAGNIAKTQEYFELYKSFFETLQKNKIRQLEGSFEREKQIALAEQKRIAEMELRLQEEAIEKVRREISAKDSTLNNLKERLTKNQMALEIIRQDSLIKALTIERLEMQQQEQQAKIRLYVVVASAALIIVCLSAWFFYVSRKRKIAENKILQIKNKEILQQNEEIAAQAAELRKLNQVKDRVFAIIGHDLRAPVASFVGIFDLYISGDISREDFLSFVPQLRSNIAQLMFTLDNLLAWGNSQIKGGHPAPEQINVREIVQEQLELLRVAAQQKQIAICNHIAEDVFCRFDKNHLQFILRNLLNNAIKFNKKNGKITFNVEQTSHHCIIILQDTGIGIAPERLPTIFEDGKSSLGTSGERGVGLGLKLCKEFAQMNFGDIWVHSELGKGSDWFVKTPLK
ncbi:ATP-binding protein [Rhodoflexus sp.]